MIEDPDCVPETPLGRPYARAARSLGQQDYDLFLTESHCAFGLPSAHPR